MHSQSKTNRLFLVIIATSEYTWKNMKRFSFSPVMLSKRPFFDLAVVQNGSSEEARTYIKSLSPEYYFERPNVGIDMGAFDYALKNVPVYPYHIFLHDDHWFSEENWLDRFYQLITTYPKNHKVIWGNIITIPQKVRENGYQFNHVAEILGYEKYKIENYTQFIQGHAGLFSEYAIRDLLRIDGFPHIHGNNRKTTQICERLFSFILQEIGYELVQIPPGYEKFLMHNTWAEENRYRKEAQVCFNKNEYEKSIEIISMVIKNYHATKHDHANIGTCFLHIHEVTQAVAHFEKAVAIDPSFEYPRKMLEQISTGVTKVVQTP